MYYSFRELPVWQNSHELSVEIFHLTKTLPRSEDYATSSQIRRSANSISANIAEGFGRKQKKEKSMFYTIARGSAFETENHLLYGHSVGYFSEKDIELMYKKLWDIIKELNYIMKSLDDSPQPQP
jgi:four helix bundle protein